MDRTHRSIVGDAQWLEQFGEVDLIGGWAEVAIDADLAGCVEFPGYQVFLTPYDPVQVFVQNRTAGGFEIHALPGPRRTTQLSLRCGYRIVGRRIEPLAEPFDNRSRRQT